MKRIILGISIVLTTLCLCGCIAQKDVEENLVNSNQYIENENKVSNKDINTEDEKNDEDNVVSKTQSGETIDITTLENIVVDENNISTNWEDGEFLYNGKKVKLICSFSELEKNLGMKFNDSMKYDCTLNPNYTASAGQCSVGNSENIVINLSNTSNEPKKYFECDVDTFSVNLFYLKKDGDTSYSKIQLANNITWDSTADEIVAAYGEPYKRTENEYGFNLYYKSDENYSKLEFGFNNELGMTSIYYTID